MGRIQSTLDSNRGIEQTKQQWNQSSTANFQARGKEERIRRERPPKSQLQRDKRFFTTTIHRQLADNSFDQQTNSNQQGNIYASQGGEENNKTQVVTQHTEVHKEDHIKTKAIYGARLKLNN